MSQADLVDIREKSATTPNYDCTGLVYQVSREGLVFVYVPGAYPDPYIDQRIKKPEERYVLGDFVSFVPPEEGNPIRHHRKSDPILKVEVNDGSILVETQVSFYPSSTNSEEALAGTAAWSPDFDVVLCEKKMSEKPMRDHMYMAWVERCEAPVQLMDKTVCWQMTDKKPLTEPLSQCQLSGAPWARRAYRRNNAMNPFGSRLGRYDRRELLKEYTKENYEGVVVRTIQDQAIVWSAGIPITEVSFMYGARDKLKVGDWIQFNCEVSRYSQHGCLLEGKKYQQIGGLVPVYLMHNNVMANLEICVPNNDSEITHFARGVVCVKSPIFGQIQFPAGTFEESFRGKTLKIRVRKLAKPQFGMSSWIFVKTLSDEEFSTIPAQPQQPFNTSSSTALMSNPEDNIGMCENERSHQRPLPGQQQGSRGISSDDVSNELYGIIIAVEADSSDVLIWTNKLDDVLWNAGASTQPFEPIIGRWLKFSSYSVETLRRGVSSSARALLRGVPEPIAHLLPTRERNGIIQLQTEITSIEPFHSRVQKAQSDLLGTVLMRNDMVLGYHCETIAFSDKFVVWVEHTQSKPAWNVVEVEEKKRDSRTQLAGNVDAQTTEEFSDSDEYDDTFEDLLVGVNGISNDNNNTNNTSNNRRNINENNADRRYVPVSARNQQQYQQRSYEQSDFSAPYSSYDRSQQFIDEREVTERSNNNMFRPTASVYGSGEFRPRMADSSNLSSAMDYSTAAFGRYPRSVEALSADQREYPPLREQRQAAQYSRGPDNNGAFIRAPPLAHNDRRYLDRFDPEEVDEYGYGYGFANGNREGPGYVTSTRRLNQRNLHSSQRERMGNLIASEVDNYNEPALRRYPNGFRSQQWHREEAEPTRSYTRNVRERDSFGRNRPAPPSSFSMADQWTRPLERPEYERWVQQQQQQQQRQRRRQPEEWTSEAINNAPNSSSQAINENNPLAVPIFGAERPIPLVQRTTNSNAQQIQRQSQQIQPNQLAQNPSETQRASVSSHASQVSSTVEITDENDPLGRPVFGAQRPVPLSSLLSPPADNNEEESLSEHGVPSQTSAVPATAAAAAPETRTSNRNNVSDQMSPSVEECMRRLWRLANNDQNGAPLEARFYSELARIAERYGWDKNGENVRDSARM